MELRTHRTRPSRVEEYPEWLANQIRDLLAWQWELANGDPNRLFGSSDTEGGDQT